MKFKSRLKQCLIYWLLAATLPAEVLAEQQIAVNGFGSIRMGKLLASNENPRLAEFYNDDGLSFKDDTLFGLQLQADTGSRLSYTLQLIGKALDNYDPEVSLAFIRYQLDPDHRLKFGRLAVPLFAQSDIQYVGYSHDYSRLPKSVYYRFDFEVADGVAFEGQQIYQNFSLNYLMQLAEFSGKVFKRQIPGGIDVKLQQMKNLRLELAYKEIQLFAGGIYGNTDGTDLNEFFLNRGIVQAVQASGASTAEQQQLLAGLSFDKAAKYAFWGLRWQHAAWKFETEQVRFGITNSADTTSTGSYVAISRRFEPVILTLHHEQIKEDPSNLPLLRQVTHPRLRQIGLQFSQSLNNVSFEMQVLSLRYDLQPGLSFKADLFSGKHDDAKIGRYKGFSLGVDFVF